MKTQVDETDIKVLIGVAANITAYFMTNQSDDVTLAKIGRRVTRDLERFGLLKEPGVSGAAEAMDALTSRLHHALGSPGAS